VSYKPQNTTYLGLLSYNYTRMHINVDVGSLASSHPTHTQTQRHHRHTPITIAEEYNVCRHGASYAEQYRDVHTDKLQTYLPYNKKTTNGIIALWTQALEKMEYVVFCFCFWFWFWLTWCYMYYEINKPQKEINKSSVK